MGSHNLFQIEKLNGRDNFATWKFSMKTYLEHEGLWQCVEPTEGKPVDAVKDVKAKAKLILLIDPQNYIHIQECTSAKEVWENLHKAFDDNGLTRKVGLLKALVNTSLESSSNVEDYISKIMSTAHKLRNIGFNVNDEWLGTLMLSGLPDTYMPMIMGLESCGTTISADLVKTKLLQEVKQSDSSAFYTKYKPKFGNFQNKSQYSGKKPSGPRCYNCNKIGHYAKLCKAPRKIKSPKNEKCESSFVAAFSATGGDETNKNWYIDSGASLHMTCSSDSMYDMMEPTVKTITVANREPLPVRGMGSINISLPQGKLKVQNVLFVPGLAANLLSVSTIVNAGNKVTFNEKGCVIYDKNGKLICSAVLNKKLYLLETKTSTGTAHLTNSKCSNDTYLWHLRMAHLNVSDVNRLPDHAEGVTLTQGKSDIPTCIQCLEGKQSRLPFNNVGTRATRPLQIIHSDLCGIMENESYSGMKYFITFIDDYTRMVHVYFMKDKLNVLEVFTDFQKKVENSLSCKIQILRTDNGLEYCNGRLEKYLASCGITHQTTTPYTPQQNGLAERMNRTLVERARCMLFFANMEKRLWAEAVSTAAYVVNRSPTKSLEGRTPYELWTGKKPNLSHMRIFGSDAMVHIPKERRKKWDKKSVKMVFVGYCENTKGYRLFDPKTHKILKSRDVMFIENYPANQYQNHFPVPVTSDSLAKESHTEASNSVQLRGEHSLESVTSPQLRNDSSHSCDQDGNESFNETDSGGFLDETYTPEETLTEMHIPTKMELRPRNKINVPDKYGDNMYCMFTDLSDPQSVEEALSSSHAREWKQAMDEEYNSLLENETWSLTDLPSNKKMLPCKWVFKTKLDQKGNIVRFKARLVIKGYAQKRGTDYDEIYSPVARYTTLRYLFALSAKFSFDIDQMDAVAAFLQGNIDADIYMMQPEMYKQGTQVCHLHKSIYGLKQASRLWNIKLNNVLHKIGMIQSKTDPCVYYNEDKNTYIAVWVDDLLIFTSQQSVKNMLKEQLQQHFKMKDLGNASHCLGLNLTRQDNKVMLDQESYIKQILTRFDMSNCKAVKTPIEVGLKFNDNNENVFSCPYQQVIGSLLFLANCTRPDLSYSVNMLSRYNKEPKIEHWTALKRILRYIQGTKDLKLVYTKEDDARITGYCDADWAGDISTRRSCSGNVFLFQGGAISWSSRKQQTVALSTAEAEYISMASATQEALWLRQLHMELGQQQASTLTIYSDNQSAIKLTTNDCYLPRSKHIDIRFHFLREHVLNCKIVFCYCSGHKMVADILTKGTTFDKHLFCITKMGLRSRESVVIMNATHV